MDTNLTKVVTCKAEEAEFKIRSLAAQGYTLTHLAATQSSGIMSTITTVLVFARSKESAAIDKTLERGSVTSAASRGKK